MLVAILVVECFGVLFLLQLIGAVNMAAKSFKETLDAFSKALSDAKKQNPRLN